MIIGIISSIIATLITNVIANYINFKYKFHIEIEEYITYVKSIKLHLEYFIKDDSIKDQLFLKINDRPLTIISGKALNETGKQIFEGINNSISCLEENESRLSCHNIELIKSIESKLQCLLVALIDNKDNIGVCYFQYIKNKVYTKITHKDDKFENKS